MIPAGLALEERALVVGDGTVWDVLHRESRLSVLRGCLTQRDAIGFANALADVDWDRPADVVRTDAAAYVRMLEVQADVLRPKATARPS